MQAAFSRQRKGMARLACTVTRWSASPFQEAVKWMLF
jgi:hypothetical protein